MSLSVFSDDDRAFLRTILANPAELTAWLVYADWLDEHDDPRAEFLRLEVKRLAPETTGDERYGIIGRQEELRATLDPDWLAIFDRPRVENCDSQFAFKCPKRWEKLKGTDEPTVRRCDACRKPVYYCHTVEEARDHARKGDCVAVAEGTPRWPDDLRRDFPQRVTMGLMIMPEPEPEPARRPWWKFW